MKKVVLLTAGQPSTSPRSIKEYLALKNAGYKVTVLYAYWADWTVKIDEQLFLDYGLDKADFVLVGGSPHEEKIIYFFSKILHKITRALSRKWRCFSELSELRVAYFAKRSAKKIHADLFVAHALGLVPAAVQAAKKNRAKVSVDFEDCFSGQWQKGSLEYKRSAHLEKKYLKRIHFCTAASPLIAKNYAERFGLSPLVVNNVFSINNLQLPNEREAAQDLKLFWFSQTVGKNRGLEEVIAAMGALHCQYITLAILGDCSTEMKLTLLKAAQLHGVHQQQLIFIQPQSLDKLFQIASKHDIGLATETGISENNNICLSNKLFSYLLSGLAIVATNTPAQEAFLNQHEAIGYTFEAGDTSSLTALLALFLNHRTLLKNCKAASLRLAKEKYNWEEESTNFLSHIAANLA